MNVDVVPNDGATYSLCPKTVDLDQLYTWNDACDAEAGMRKNTSHI